MRYALALMLIAGSAALAQSSVELEADWMLQLRRFGGDKSMQSGYPLTALVERGRKLAADLRVAGVDVAGAEKELGAIEEAARGAKTADEAKALYVRLRGVVRKLMLANPLLDFDQILFVKGQPGQFTHMSDQYYGWWSRPGGGICILENFKSGEPKARCITEGKLAPGSFVRPELSYDGKRVLFAYAKHYPHVAGLRDKLNKGNIPEDAFYQVFEMNIDGSGLRQLTSGKYDSFDARYLPDGRIVFLSTRRGQFVQCGAKSAAATTTRPALPDIYVRCGGDAFRPVPVYTLHTMDADGKNLCAISAFEMFEWTPAIAHDGRILYARWDYVDRHNMPFMKLWSTNPDGSNPQIVWGNFERSPHAAFEARPVPGSNKIIFVGSAHHAHAGGPLVMLDPDAGADNPAAITKLTPEVCYPESNGKPETYFVTPWPLSEKYHLVGWSGVALQIGDGAGAWGMKPNPGNALGLYVFDTFGDLELIYRDPAISSSSPIPLRARAKPALYGAGASEAIEGHMLVQNVYQGLEGVAAGSIKRLRIVAIPGKTQPWMNNPHMGATRDDPGKCVLGTVPVEADGSAYFRVPAGVSVFFQALDESGVAVQTMRSATYVQPGQTLSCIGCHERRTDAPAASRSPLAARREASKITVGPEGSWPLRYDKLVQPVLQKHCVSCHQPTARDKAAAKVDLSLAKSYATLAAYRGKTKSLHQIVQERYNQSRSPVNGGEAATSALGTLLRDPKGHYEVKLDADARDRLLTWMDTYAQMRGSFDDKQERELERLKKVWAEMLER